MFLIFMLSHGALICQSLICLDATRTSITDFFSHFLPYRNIVVIKSSFNADTCHRYVDWSVTMKVRSFYLGDIIYHVISIH